MEGGRRHPVALNKDGGDTPTAGTNRKTSRPRGPMGNHPESAAAGDFCACALRRQPRALLCGGGGTRGSPRRHQDTPCCGRGFIRCLVFLDSTAHRGGGRPVLTLPPCAPWKPPCGVGAPGGHGGWRPSGGGGPGPRRSPKRNPDSGGDSGRVGPVLPACGRSLEPAGLSPPPGATTGRAPREHGPARGTCRLWRDERGWHSSRLAGQTVPSTLPSPWRLLRTFKGEETQSHSRPPSLVVGSGAPAATWPPAGSASPPRPCPAAAPPPRS